MVKLDLKPLLKHETDTLDFAFYLEEPGIDNMGEPIAFEGPVKAMGSVKRIAEQIFLEIDIEASLITQCARCLQTVLKPINISCFEELLPFAKEKEVEQDENVFFYKNHSIDLLGYARELVIVSMPFKTVCQDNCKGICTLCGKNRNEGVCECAVEDVEKDNVDPRLAQLRDWLHNAKE